MFENKILHPESGNGFYRSFNSIHYFKGFGEDVMTTECFLSSEQVEQRFEELKKMLVTEPQQAEESKFWEIRSKKKIYHLLDNVDEYLLKELQTKLNEDK